MNEDSHWKRCRRLIQIMGRGYEYVGKEWILGWLAETKEITGRYLSSVFIPLDSRRLLSDASASVGWAQYFPSVIYSLSSY
jgi:hypothetical protein